MKNLEGFTYPTAGRCDEITVFDQNKAIWDLKRNYGVCRSRPIFV